MSAYRRAGGSVILGYVTALFNFTAEIAQLVEHNLAKVGVASSSLVFRSEMDNLTRVVHFFCLRKTTASASAPVGCFAGSLYSKRPSNVRAGAGGDCLQASAAGGFGLTTSAKWLLLVISTSLSAFRLKITTLWVVRVAATPRGGSQLRQSSLLPPLAATRTLRVSYWQPLP